VQHAWQVLRAAIARVTAAINDGEVPVVPVSEALHCLADQAVVPLAAWNVLGDSGRTRADPGGQVARAASEGLAQNVSHTDPAVVGTSTWTLAESFGSSSTLSHAVHLTGRLSG
jgi:hypothetical protein